MPDHVPVAEPPSGLAAWQRSLPWWDTYFGVVVLVTMAFAREPVAVGLLLAMVAWYVWFGRDAMWCDRPTWYGIIYLVGAAVLFIPAVALVSGASFILFALSPQAHMALQFRWAVPATVVLNLIPAAAQFIRTGRLLPTLPIGIMAIVLTAVIGYSIDLLIAQARELTASRAEVARLSRAAERQRLGADLHDTIAQGLSSVVMLVQAADAALDRNPAEARRHLDLAARTARENLQELRAVLDALMPSAHDLPSALHRLAARFTEETGVPASVGIAGVAQPLAVATEVVLLRSAQESLSNIRQHAKAGTVVLRLSYLAGAVRLEVVDDGRGFEHTEIIGGYGIQGMRSRASQVGGEFEVLPTPAGTTVRVEVPA